MARTKRFVVLAWLRNDPSVTIGILSKDYSGATLNNDFSDVT